MIVFLHLFPSFRALRLLALATTVAFVVLLDIGRGFGAIGALQGVEKARNPPKRGENASLFIVPGLAFAHRRDLVAYILFLTIGRGFWRD